MNIEKLTDFIKGALKSKTIIFMAMAAVLPVLDLLHQVDLKAILTPIMCGENPTVECIANGPEKFYAGYILVITTTAKVLRFLTTGSLEDKGQGKDA